MKNRIAIVREPFKICIEERELRKMGDDEAVIEVKSSSICGSDLHIFKGKHPAVKLPVTIGHEFSGVIAKIGKDSNNFKVGDRVVLEPIINCGKCEACKSGNYGLCENASFSYRVGDGAMADYVVCKTAHLFKLSDAMSFDVGALIEPLSVANRAVKRSGAGSDDSVIIFGAGPIGLFITAILSHKGVQDITVVDFSEKRLEAALRLGALHIIDLSTAPLEESIAENHPKGFDTAFEVAGKEATFNNALKNLKVDGTLVQVGIYEDPNITFDASILINKQIKIIGTQGYNNDFEEVIKIASRLDLEQLITHVFPLSKIQEALECNLNSSKTGAIKVLIHPGEE
ncbi:MAG: alcohol dehydrogenase catalytic domain-containing protein [Anaerolineaceae bacterium]|nr:alcohol dehydrogenase catalytic domain-containing protein [Anaerolineaceae bacterium]